METEVQGYSRKGKRFLSFDTNLTEPIQSMWVSMWHKWYSLYHYNNILIQLTCHPAKISMPVFLHRCGYVKFIRKLMLLVVNLCCITVFNCWQLLPYTKEFLLGCPRIYSCTWNVSVTIGHKWSTISTAWLSWGQPLMVYAYGVQICTSCQLWYGCRNDNTLLVIVCLL